MEGSTGDRSGEQQPDEVPQEDYAIARAKAALEEAEREEAAAAAAAATAKGGRRGFLRRRPASAEPAAAPAPKPDAEPDPEPDPEPADAPTDASPQVSEPETPAEPVAVPEPAAAETPAAEEPEPAEDVTAKADAKAGTKPDPKADGDETPETERPRDKKAEKAEKKRKPPTEPSGPSEIPEQSAGLLRAVHPRHALLMGLAVGAAAFASGRPGREALVAGGAVLVVQVILGLVNDAGDEDDDRATGAPGKPVAEGHLPAGNATFIAACLAILAVPLSLQNGWIAAAALAAYLVLALLSRTSLRRSWLSWLPWAASFAALPAFLSYGGWGARAEGVPPTWEMTAAAAALGVGVHFALSVSHLVADNKAKRRHLPLRLALKIGAGPLLVLTVIWLVASVAAIVWVGLGPGLRQ